MISCVQITGFLGDLPRSGGASLAAQSAAQQPVVACPGFLANRTVRLASRLIVAAGQICITFRLGNLAKLQIGNRGWQQLDGRIQVGFRPVPIVSVTSSSAGRKRAAESSAPVMSTSNAPWRRVGTLK